MCAIFSSFPRILHSIFRRFYEKKFFNVTIWKMIRDLGYSWYWKPRESREKSPWIASEVEMRELRTFIFYRQRARESLARGRNFSSRDASDGGKEQQRSSGTGWRRRDALSRRNGRRDDSTALRVRYRRRKSGERMEPGWDWTPGVRGGCKTVRNAGGSFRGTFSPFRERSPLGFRRTFYNLRPRN